ncbi:mitochondrial large ribosomal subunit [Diplodia corticola]|uniref:Large ribosomal subunit protein mL49 n=1 Tax=Diplodia corticola TaxID=236234 RepID=A0A1J9S4U0_9PEZI|nr:mitochondrial large ribosomal subunit [Diplodia corticola]OJD34645.1 mitochondrial large ribosomal subunit [Diplodia corticola]
MAFARSGLSLFRPVATPTPAAVTQIHRFSQRARLRQEAKITTASTTAPVDANASAVEQARPPALPYFVQRSSSNNLPVYLDQKRGGNRTETKVRKVSGDSQALKKELQTYLNISAEDIWVTHPSGHIVAKGQHYSKTIEFLESKKF